MNLLAVIRKLEELEKKATPGKWLYDSYHQVWHCDQVLIEICSSQRRERDANLEFISESRNALPTLLAALREAVLLAKHCEQYGNIATCGIADKFLSKWITE